VSRDARRAAVTSRARTCGATVTSGARRATRLPARAPAPRRAALPARAAAPRRAAARGATLASGGARATMTASAVGAPGASTTTQDREDDTGAEQLSRHGALRSNARTTGYP
jgi:hypothetical protein